MNRTLVIQVDADDKLCGKCTFLHGFLCGLFSPLEGITLQQNEYGEKRRCSECLECEAELVAREWMTEITALCSHLNEKLQRCGTPLSPHLKEGEKE